MRIITIFLIFLFLETTMTFSQILVEEFNYSENQLLTSNGWVAYSAENSNPVMVVSGSLGYPNYCSSNVGNSIQVIGTSSSSEDVKKTFETVSSGSIYSSFLVNFNSATTATNGEYFLGFLTSTGATLRGRLFIKKSGSNIAFGISKGGNTLEEISFTAFSYSLNTTYLLVLKYTFSSSSDDDVIDLFINPDLSGAEPSPDLTNTDIASDLSEIGAIALRQGTASFNVIIDGIRVANSWDLAPLPVELTSFSAEIANQKVSLEWKTATEVNNYGFNIERKQETGYWSKVGFVEGHGNSNSPKFYSFVDKSLTTPGKYLYRLKQIDIDGKYKYSDEVEIQYDVATKFELLQNYPNPFNPTTSIKYSVPKISDANFLSVQLIVYDVLGRKVETLVNERKSPGNYEIKFNAGKLNSGIYYYELKTGDFHKIKKMILLK